MINLKYENPTFLRTQTLSNISLTGQTQSDKVTILKGNCTYHKVWKKGQCKFVIKVKNLKKNLTLTGHIYRNLVIHYKSIFQNLGIVPYVKVLKS